MASEPEKLGFYDDIENLKKLCNFLRTNEGPPVREAVEMDKRVHYLKGVCFKSTGKNTLVKYEHLTLTYFILYTFERRETC
jgi:hypothetical protein